jgi:formylglycine-generating enzyme required for sulfatase activity
MMLNAKDTPNRESSDTGPIFVNSLGMKMIRIPAGTFVMGNDSATPRSLGQLPRLTNGDYDERPLHKVKI